MKYTKRIKHREMIINYTASCMFAIILYSAEALKFLPIMSSASNDRMVSNSLPFLITTVFMIVQVYINTFLLRQKGQEFAQYMLSGFTKKQICMQYIMNYVSVNGKALGLSMIISAIGVIIYIFLTGSSVTFLQALITAFKTAALFVIGCLLPLIFIVRNIKRLSIHKLMNQKKMNEAGPTAGKKIKLHMSVLGVSVIMYISQMIFFDPFRISFISIFIILIIYEGYRLLAWYIQACRCRKGKALYKRNRLFISAQLLFRANSWIRLSAVISAVSLIALTSFTLGIILINGDLRLFENNALDQAMGIIQIYIALIFTIVIFIILSIRQAVDIVEHNHNYLIMRSLGKNRNDLDKILLLQISMQFFTPFLMALVLLILSSIPIYINISTWIRATPVLYGIIGYISILIILGLLYIYITFVSYKKSQKFYIWQQ